MTNRITAILLTVAMPLLSHGQTLPADGIDAVTQRMTLEEKARMLNGAVAHSQHGLNFVANSSQYVEGAAGPTMEYPAYGIPRTIFADGPAGVRISPQRAGDSATYYCTAFPVGTALAATWNVETVYDVCAAMGSEALHYGIDALLGPGMNIQRNPLCGRNFEYFSEDPLLTGMTAAAYVNGIQSQGVGACIKHFAANNQETSREVNDVRADERTLREIYLRAFEIALQHSSPWLLMTAYNRINGAFCCENRWLIEEVLRREWGFDGLVVTDWIGRHDTAAQVRAGNDLIMPGSEEQIDDIIDAVREGRLDEADVDRNVRRVLRYVSRTPRYKGHTGDDKPDLQASAAISRRAAAEGMVLLKNDGVLPLNDTALRIALYGLSSYDIITGGTGSGHVNCAGKSQPNDALRDCGFSVNESLERLYTAYRDYARARVESESAWVLPAFGFPRLPEMPISGETVAAGERASDIAVVTIGRSAGEGADRTPYGDYILGSDEERMLRTVCERYHAAGKKVIVVLNIDGAIDVASWRHLPDAILCAWLPGQEGGAAIADILTGKTNPSGRLPMTFAARYEDYASSRNFPVAERDIPQPYFGFREQIPPRTCGKDRDSTRYDEGIYVGYRHFDKHGIRTAYPFGYGLCYTTFGYDGMKVVREGDAFRITCTVTNTGKAAGRETVQLYVAAPAASMDKPVKELRAFAKTKELQAGESQTVTLRVSVADLASFDNGTHRWITEKGIYRFILASDAENAICCAEAKLPKEYIR